MHRYTLGRTLGEGAFGRVRQAIHKESGEEVRSFVHAIFRRHRKVVAMHPLTIQEGNALCVPRISGRCKNSERQMPDSEECRVSPRIQGTSGFVTRLLLIREYSSSTFCSKPILTRVILTHKPFRKKALRALSHENIVKCKDLILGEKGDVHMVFEMLHGGNLEKLTRNRTKPFSEHQIRSVFFQLLSAANHMHTSKFIHRDIKPENILLLSPKFEYDERIKLADLGQAKHFSSSNVRPQTTYVATRWYRSPELLLRMHSYSFPSDLWAIGAVMTELINLGEPLFPGSDEHDQLSRIIALRGHPSTVGWRNGEIAMKNRRIQLPKVTPSSLRKIVPRASLPVLQLISDLLELDPSRRPSAAEALQYPLFASFSPVLSRNPSRRKRRIDSVEKDTARTRDFPSSRWSRESECKRNGNIGTEEKNSYVANWTNESAVQTPRKRSKKRRTSECRSMLFKIPRISRDDHESSEDYCMLRARRDPAGTFDLRKSG